MTTSAGFACCEKRFFERMLEFGWAPTVVFDIGAAHGSWSSVIAEALPEARFELFEPLATVDAEYRERLDETLREHPGFRLHEFALGDRNGEAEFWRMPSAVGSSLLSAGAPLEERIRVPVRRLDDAVAALGLPQPQLIKMDVQGGEALVIKGGVRTVMQADMLHLETWLRRGYGKTTPLLTELMEGLRPLGFVLVHLGDFYREGHQELASVDAFFAHARLVERLRESGAGFPWPASWEG